MTIRSSANPRVLGALLAAVSVLTFNAFNAGAASASKLVLKISGSAAPSPSKAYVEIGLNIGGPACLFGTYQASLISNSLATDTIENKTPIEINAAGPCVGVSISPSSEITVAKISSSGKFTVKANPAIKVTKGSCTYATSKITGTFPVPGTAFAYTAVTGKRKPPSAPTCAKTYTYYESAVAMGGWKATGAPQDYELEDIT